MGISATLASSVRSRAAFCCEYCLLPVQASLVSFEIDHIIAKKHGGQSDSENLALSCFYCNSAKGPNFAGIDSDTGSIVSLFHSRSHKWHDHFRLNGSRLVGLTMHARATIAVLEMNAEDMVLLRSSLIREGMYPPTNFGNG